MNSSTEMKQLIIQNIRNDIQSRNPIFINLALQCVANIGDREMATAFSNEIPRLLISGFVKYEFNENELVAVFLLLYIEIQSIRLNNRLHFAY